MTDTDDKQIERAPQADNALKHGIHRYIKTGELPDDLRGFDTALAGELLHQAGDNERNATIALLCAKRLTIVELGWRVVLQHYEKAKEHGTYAFPEVLRILNSYMEGARRDLQELGLTPASAGRIAKLGDDPITAAKVLSEIQGAKGNEQST